MTDEMLMEAVKNGDLQQASGLFERYNRAIFSYLVRMTFDRQLAEDLTQNVFLRVIRYRNSYHEGNSFKSWVYQIARNVLSDHYRRVEKMNMGSTDLMNVGDSLAEAQEEADQHERERILHQSLLRLSEDQRELIVLTRFQRMRYEEVANIKNTTVANIKVKIHRAIRQLREHYFQLERA